MRYLITPCFAELALLLRGLVEVGREITSVERGRRSRPSGFVQPVSKRLTFLAACALRQFTRSADSLSAKSSLSCSLMRRAATALRVTQRSSDKRSCASTQVIRRGRANLSVFAYGLGARIGRNTNFRVSDIRKSQNFLAFRRY